MPRYLISVHRPGPPHAAPSLEPADIAAIDALNDAMVAAGVRLFVGGLRPPACAQSIRLGPEGMAEVTAGPLLDAPEWLDGFWVIEADDADQALTWGRKAAAACRAAVEVRPFN